MKRVFYVFVALTLFLTAQPQILAQGNSLNDSVPYQNHPILSNPLPATVIDEDKVSFECDWSTMLGMIRDLDERIAGALEVDTVHDTYATREDVNTSVFLRFDCVVLRDSVLSLQLQLDEALLGPPSVLSQEVVNIAQRVATI